MTNLFDHGLMTMRKVRKTKDNDDIEAFIRYKDREKVMSGLKEWKFGQDGRINAIG